MDKADDSYPVAADPAKVGTYPGLVKAGGGLVWDAVLEYRVWCHPKRDRDYFRAFATYKEARDFSARTEDAEEPLALVVQEEYIDEPRPGEYLHVRERRVTEWPVGFLRRPKRTRRTIPDFLSSDDPSTRLEIIRGTTEGT